MNANNISGQWELSSWNGEPLDEGIYYLDIDPEIGAVIRGDYDYDSGDWGHRYIITDLTHSHMTWTAKDDPGFVQIWNRVDSIPVAAVAEE